MRGSKRVLAPGSAVLLAALLPFASVADVPQSGFAPNLETVGIRDIQQQLRAHGYDPGPDNGTMNETTHLAILAYQHDYGLREDGIAGPGLENMLHFLRRRPMPPVAYMPPAPYIESPPQRLYAPPEGPTGTDPAYSNPSRVFVSPPFSTAPTPPAPLAEQSPDPEPPVADAQPEPPEQAFAAPEAQAMLEPPPAEAPAEPIPAAPPDPYPAQVLAPPPPPVPAPVPAYAPPPPPPPMPPQNQAEAGPPPPVAPPWPLGEAARVTPALPPAAAMTELLTKVSPPAPSGSGRDLAAESAPPPAAPQIAPAPVAPPAIAAAPAVADPLAVVAIEMPGAPAPVAVRAASSVPDPLAVVAIDMPPRPAQPPLPTLALLSPARKAPPPSDGSVPVAEPRIPVASGPLGTDPAHPKPPPVFVPPPFSTAPTRTDADEPSGDAYVREAQGYLKQLGFFGGPADGVLDWPTVEALVKFDASGTGPTTVIANSKHLDEVWIARLKTAVAAKGAAQGPPPSP